MDALLNLLDNSRPYKVKDGRVFFIDVPTDAPKPAEDFDPLDQSRWSNWRKANFEYFKKYLANESTDKNFVDIGAGPSRFRELTQRFKLSVGVDFYPHELVQVVADVTQKLPFKDEVFDIIFISNVLEHLPNPAEFVADCFRILKRGGLLVGAVPFIAKVHQAPYDFYRYTGFALEKIFSDSGFQKSEIESLGKSSDLYESAQRHFFADLHGRSRLRFLAKLPVRFAEKLSKWANKIAEPFSKNLAASPKWTEGYGFRAWK